MIPYNCGLPYSLIAVNPPMHVIFSVSISSTTFFFTFVFLSQIPDRGFSQVFLFWARIWTWCFKCQLWSEARNGLTWFLWRRYLDLWLNAPWQKYCPLWNAWGLFGTALENKRKKILITCLRNFFTPNVEDFLNNPDVILLRKQVKYIHFNGKNCES